uniref:helix-turn-helix transcriptional regulator n=1 Tax=uncultured Allisonella sp. TaxID=339338 RepID=UPI002804BBA4|nr:helix-turn-helix transcriptional regulator [uncultured Allisonella sp.]
MDGKKIKNSRLEKSMTQKDLEKMSGISRATISAIENGEVKNLRISTMKALSKALDKSIRYLFLD